MPMEYKEEEKESTRSSKTSFQEMPCQVLQFELKNIALDDSFVCL